MILSSNDQQKWRHERLEKVKRVSSTILGMTEGQLSKLVLGLHDSKGHLVVVWDSHDHSVDNLSPTPEQKRAFGVAWSMSGENETSVTHEHGLEGLDRWA